VKVMVNLWPVALAMRCRVNYLFDEAAGQHGRQGALASKYKHTFG